MASRIEFWLVSEDVCHYVKKTCIKPIALCPDHCAVTITILVDNTWRGPGYWKLNNSLIDNLEYRQSIRAIINDTKNSVQHGESVTLAWDLYVKQE